MKLVLFPNGISIWRILRWIVFAITFFLLGNCYMFARFMGTIPGF